MPQSVLIENRPFWARILAVFWLAEIALGLGFAVTGLAWIGAEGLVLAAVMLICGLLLAGVGVVMAALSWRIARLKGPAVTMTGAGLCDRRIAGVVTPWSAISWKIVFNSRSYSLQFDVAVPYRDALLKHWDQRLMGRVNRAFGFPEFTVVTLGTAMSAAGIGDLMSRFKARNT